MSQKDIIAQNRLIFKKAFSYKLRSWYIEKVSAIEGGLESARCP